MNNTRRKDISEAIKIANEIQEKLEELQSVIEQIKEEEQEYLDNMPENLSGSERYEKAEAAVDNLDAAYDWFDGIDFDELTDGLNEAME